MRADADKADLDEAAGSGASTDPASSQDIDAQQVDHLLIVKAFADDLDLVETVNRLAPSQMGGEAWCDRARACSGYAYGALASVSSGGFLRGSGHGVPSGRASGGKLFQ